MNRSLKQRIRKLERKVFPKYIYPDFSLDKKPDGSGYFDWVSGETYSQEDVDNLRRSGKIVEIVTYGQW